MDRGYLDFERLHRFTDEAAFFVTRTKKGIQFRRRASHPVDFATGLVSDHTVALATAKARHDYPDQLRRVRYVDPATTKRLTFLTNNFTLPALSIPQLYKSRWYVELFFRWIKQHLRIKAFYGTSENAVKTQIWIALSIYVLVAIVKKRLALDISLYKLLQILSVTLFEKTPFLLRFLMSAPNLTRSTTVTNCNCSTYDRTLLGANGCDIHIRRCPRCMGGQPGLAY
jgi:Transposase DDE domain